MVITKYRPSPTQTQAGGYFSNPLMVNYRLFLCWFFAVFGGINENICWHLAGPNADKRRSAAFTLERKMFQGSPIKS
jgi:hypothetical protein